MRNMRTVLRLMGAITLSTTAASSVVACKSEKNQFHRLQTQELI